VQQVNDLAHSHEDALIADAIRQGQDVKILVGLQAGSHPEAANIRALVQLMADAANAQVGYLTDGANSAGAWLAGAVPHRLAGGGAISVPGLNAKTMFDQPRQSYILMNIEPNLDYANRPAMTAALEQAELVVALSIFRDPLLQQYADVILPITPYTETSGTLVNMSGQWQTFTGVATPLGQARPGWKVLRVLGNVLHCVGFDYESSSEISAEVTANLSTASSHATSRFELKLPQLAQAKSLTGVYSRVADIPLYATDSIVRRAEALQKTQHIIEGNLIAARLHPQTAADLHIKEMHWVTAKQGDATLRLPVIFDLTVPPGAVAIATALDETSSLGELFGLIELEAYEHSSL
jgi:NADH-quinone oxidoreductase subunit G